MATHFLRLLVLVLCVLFAADNCAQKRSFTYNPAISKLGQDYTSRADELAGEAQYPDANYYLKKAIPLYKKTGNWVELVRCYIKLGNNYRDINDYGKAKEHLNQALKLALNHLKQKPLALAKSFIKLAYRYFHQKKNYDRALELYQTALDIEIEVLGEDHPEVAKIYNSMALVYWNKGQAQKATAYYNRSFLIKLKKLRGRRVELAQNFKYLDRETVKRGTFQEEQDSFRETLSRNIETYGHNHPLVATIHENIGILHAFEGRYDNAMEHLQRSLTIRLNVFGREHLETASSYHNIGICLRLQGKYERALAVLDDALAIKLSHQDEFHPDTAETYYQLGNVHQSLGLFADALDYYQDAIVALVPGFFDTDYRANPDIDRAHSKDRLLKILAAKARTLKMFYLYEPERVDDLHLSLATYLLTSRLIENLRSGYKSESYKLFFGEQCLEIWGQALETALEVYDLAENVEFKELAFTLSERSKAAALSDAIFESQARKFAGIPAYLLEKEKKLKTELALYDAYLEKEYGKGASGDRTRIANIEDYYFKLREEYQNLIDHFEDNYEKYHALKYKSRLAPVPELQLALDRHSAIIEYFISERTIHIFVLTRDTLHAASLPLPDNFNRDLETFYGSIKKIEEGVYLELSRRLYGILIAPIRKHLEKKERLIIIPHGHLYYIPFEALAARPADGADFSRVNFLIKHFSFNYHYSANLWLYNVRQKAAHAQEKSFVGFAPVFSGGGNGLSELPATEEELRSIMDLFTRRKRMAAGYFHRQAGEGVFKSRDMREYGFIHLATHSLGSFGRSSLSGLFFARPVDAVQTAPKAGASYEEDGILYSSEIYNMNLNARLVVLSSCESGIGQLVKGEGMFALARGFFYAGVHNVIFSLWRVEDRSTSQLMIELYRNILAESEIPQALRRAKLALIRDRFTAFPKYWAGFILIGE